MQRPQNQQWRTDRYHLASCVCSGGLFLDPWLFAQLNIDSKCLSPRLTFEPERQRAARAGRDKRWTSSLLARDHTEYLLLAGAMLYLLFLSPGFLFMAVPRGGTMWGYTFRMCRGFPCRDNDASGRASARPLCCESFIQLRVNSPTLPNSTSFCILFWNSKVWCYTDFRTVIFFFLDFTRGTIILHSIGVSVNLHKIACLARCYRLLPVINVDCLMIG